MKEKTQSAEETTPWVAFRLGKEEFGADVSSVLEISRMLEITKIPQADGRSPAWIGIEGMVNLRGQVIAVIDLARRFGLKPKGEPQKPAPKTERIVIVHVGRETVGLMVDEVPEIVRIGQDAIEPMPEILQTEIKRDYILGIAKVGPRLIVLLDLNRILSPEEVQTPKNQGGSYG